MNVVSLDQYRKDRTDAFVSDLDTLAVMVAGVIAKHRLDRAGVHSAMATVTEVTCDALRME